MTNWDKCLKQYDKANFINIQRVLTNQSDPNRKMDKDMSRQCIEKDVQMVFKM